MLTEPAQAATSVRVESQITAHNLPYLASPYVDGSALAAGTYAPVECQASGRESIGGSYTWYRVNGLYYPAYAFATDPVFPACGHATTVPLAANGYTAPTFDSTPRAGWFSTNDSVAVLCTAAGQAVDDIDAWFFVRGYWLHSSRIAENPNGNGYPTCRGYTRPDSAKIAATINAASAMLGQYDYSWGGGGKDGPSFGVCCSPSHRDGSTVYGFDCSGLTQYAFWQGAGIDIGSTSVSQYTNGYKVALSSRRAGDLIFWSSSSKTVSDIHHVALYVGSGDIIESTPATGDDIRRRSFSTAETGVMPYVVRPVH
jgi:hypothetical protein